MSVISFTPTLLPVSNKLKSLLNQTLCDYLTQATQLNQQSADRYTFNFRDTSYDAENGGFRPVEMTINQQSSGEWNIEYITEFAYFGNYYPELEKVWILILVIIVGLLLIVVGYRLKPTSKMQKSYINGGKVTS